jgi:hypothetical protein
MSKSYKLTTVSKEDGAYGVAVDFDGLVSYVLGPFANRRAARGAIAHHIEHQVGGNIVKRIRIGKDIEHMRPKVGGASCS